MLTRNPNSGCSIWLGKLLLTFVYFYNLYPSYIVLIHNTLQYFYIKICVCYQFGNNFNFDIFILKSESGIYKKISRTYFNLEILELWSIVLDSVLELSNLATKIRLNLRLLPCLLSLFNISLKTQILSMLIKFPF